MLRKKTLRKLILAAVGFGMIGSGLVTLPASAAQVTLVGTEDTSATAWDSAKKYLAYQDGSLKWIYANGTLIYETTIKGQFGYYYNVSNSGSKGDTKTIVDHIDATNVSETNMAAVYHSDGVLNNYYGRDLHYTTTAGTSGTTSNSNFANTLAYAQWNSYVSGVSSASTAVNFGKDAFYIQKSNGNWIKVSTSSTGLSNTVTGDTKKYFMTIDEYISKHNAVSTNIVSNASSVLAQYKAHVYYNGTVPYIFVTYKDSDSTGTDPILYTGDVRGDNYEYLMPNTNAAAGTVGTTYWGQKYVNYATPTSTSGSSGTITANSINGVTITDLNAAFAQTFTNDQVLYGRDIISGTVKGSTVTTANSNSTINLYKPGTYDSSTGTYASDTEHPISVTMTNNVWYDTSNQNSISFGNSGQNVPANTISDVTSYAIGANTIYGAKDFAVGGVTAVNTIGTKEAPVTGAVVYGSGNKVTKDNATAIGNGTTVDQANSVAIGNASATKAANTGDTATKVTLGTGTTATTTTFAGAASTTNGVFSVGAAGAERQIQNVAAGDISSASTDAVNGSQLYATNQQVNTNATNIAGNTTNINTINTKLGDTTNISTTNTTTVTNPTTVTDNINNLYSEVNTGYKYAGNTSTTDGGDNVALGKTISIVGGVTTTDTTKGNYDASNLTTVETKDTTTGNSTITVEMSKTPSFTSVTAGTDTTKQVTISDGGVKVGGNTYVTSSGVNANSQTITNVLGGINDTDAANYGQVKNAVTNVTSTTNNNGSNTVTYKTLATGDTAQTMGTFATADYQLVANPTEGSKGIYTVGTDGTVGLTVQDSISGTQKNVTLADIAKKSTVDTLSDFAVKYDKNADDTVNKDSVTLNSTTKYVSTKNADGTTATHTGGTSLTNVSYADGKNGGAAVNYDLLKDTVLKSESTLTDTGMVFAGNTGSDKVKLGKTVNIKGSDKKSGTTYSSDNLTTEEAIDKDGNSTISILMSTTPTFDTLTATKSLTVGSGTTTIVMNGTDQTIKGLSNTTWKGTATTGYAANRAATEGELNGVAAGAVQYDKNTDGTINYNSVTMGNGSGTTYSTTNHSGGTSVTNVSYAVTDRTNTNYNGGAAVNTDLLNDKITEAKNAATNNDQHIKAGSYAVGNVAGDKNKNSVSMDIIDGTNKKTGEVTITDIAKASDMGSTADINNQITNKDAAGNTTTTTVVDAVNNLNTKVGDTTKINSDIMNKDAAGNTTTTSTVDAINNLDNKVDTKVGDNQYSKTDLTKGNTINDGDSSTTAISKLENQITTNNTTVNNTIDAKSVTGGSVSKTESDTINLTNKAGDIVAKVTGVSDERLVNGTDTYTTPVSNKSITGYKVDADNGTVTMNVVDKNDATKTSTVNIVDVASKTQVDKIANTLSNYINGSTTDEKGNVTGGTTINGDISTTTTTTKTDGSTTTNTSNLVQAVNALDQGAVKYNVTKKSLTTTNTDGSTTTTTSNVIDYQAATLGNTATSYKSYAAVRNTKGAVTSSTGGTSLSQVAYAETDNSKESYDGSSAVNVDLLKTYAAKSTDVGDTNNLSDSVKNTVTTTNTDGTKTTATTTTSVVDAINNVAGNSVHYDVNNGTVNKNSITLGGGTEGTTITNVAGGAVSSTSTDAVNGSQLYEVNANSIARDTQLSQNIGKLDERVNRVGAGAAALAGLHPLDYDSEYKWDFAASMGQYRGTSAAALGAFYRPNEDVMFSFAASTGNGDSMWNAGISFKLGPNGSGLPTARADMAREIRDLKGENKHLSSANQQLNDKVEALSVQNKALSDKVDALFQQVQAMVKSQQTK